MRVETSHHVDASELREDGSYDWHYEYDLWVFTDGAVSLVARGYSDAPSSAHFLRLEINGERRPLSIEDVSSTLATEAADHLRGIGRTALSWLSRGYEPLPQQ